MLQDIAILITVGLLWGITNPFIGKAVTVDSAKFDALDFSFKSLLSIITRIRFALPFLINQAGSILYFYSLGQIPSHIMSVSTNSLTLAVTMITECLINGKLPTWRKVRGLALIIIGVGLVML